MIKCTFLDATYEPSDSVEMQGTYEETKKYRKNGYYEKESRNGYWVLVKPSRISVNIKTEEGTDTIYFKEEILDFYQRTRMTQKLFDTFVSELGKGEINIYRDKYGSYRIE